MGCYHVEGMICALGNIVVMVDDGDNNVPALKQAVVGLARGMGTDIVIKTADIILSNRKLSNVP